MITCVDSISNLHTCKQCIQIRTNMPGIGSLMREIALKFKNF